MNAFFEKYIVRCFFPAMFLLFLGPAILHGNGETILSIGKSYTLSPAPNYHPPVTEEGDKTQLTDGIYTKGWFWAQASTVGWMFQPMVVITIDLGKAEPIKGVSFSTAAGDAGVKWPSAIHILVSEDGNDYFSAGELISLTEGPRPESAPYRLFRYRTDKLSTKGRYVRLAVFPTGTMIFCDEIEICRGDDYFLNIPYSGSPVTPSDLMNEGKATDYYVAAPKMAPQYLSWPDIKDEELTKKGCRRRFQADLRQVENLLQASNLSSEDKNNVLLEIKSIAGEILKTAFPENPEGFKAIVPYNDLHRRIFKLNAKILAAKGFSPLSLWHKERYAPLTLFEEPAGTLSDLKVTMMQNEYRSEAFNLTNASQSDIEVKFQITGLQGGLNPDYVTPYQVEFVDTKEGVVVASALVKLEKEDGWYGTNVVSGMTRQIWLSFHPKSVKPGDYRGSIAVKSGPLTKDIPVVLSLAPVVFPEKTDLTFGMWDYVSLIHKHLNDINKNTRAAAIEDMNTHFINRVCESWITPYPKPEDIDKDGNILKEPDFSEFDVFVKTFPDARYYDITFSIDISKPVFVGLAAGTEPFNNAVSQWAAMWAKHNREIGLKPGQVMLNIVDEPGSWRKNEYKIILDFAKAIKKGTNEIFIFIDPVRGFDKEPWEEDFSEEAFIYCDIVCPLLDQYLAKKERKDFYAGLQQKGKTLYFYMCFGPTRLFDPVSYFRLQPWHCFNTGAAGSNFWSYSDAGGGGSKGNSWNEYELKRVSFSPVYIGPDSITNSKHWEAAREGVEDYQYLTMLKNKVEQLEKQGKESPLVAEGRNILKSLPQEVISAAGERDKYKSWFNFKDEDYLAVDRARIKILNLLTELNKL